MSFRGWRVLHTKQQSTVPNGCSSNAAYTVVLEHRSKKEVLLFQQGVITELSSAEFDLIRTQYSILFDCYGCLGVYESHVKNENLLHLVLVTQCFPVGKLPTFEVFLVSAVTFVCLNSGATDVDAVSDVRKLLSAGTFFFARETTSGMPYDLTLSIQKYYLSVNNTEVVRAWGKSDFRFLWNKGLMAAISRVGICPTKWLTPIICGQFDVKTVYSGNNQSRVGLVSRISTEHPGTRFNVRGVNDDGDVANFVETEQFVYWNNQVASHVQVRGTVPLFWEQPGIQVGSHKIKLSRLPETSLPAFQRHFADILSRYGETVIINLLGSKEGEGQLSTAYHDHLKMSEFSGSIAYHHFDYHAKVTSQNFENLQAFLAKLEPQLHAWDFFHMKGSEVKRVQKGVVRVNCVDCLDRTNMVQSAIALDVMLPHILVAVGLLSSKSDHLLRRFTETARDSWQKNGDNVSRMYTGTGALGKDRSKLRNVQRSAVRTIQNNFLDGSKNEAMLSLLSQTELHGWMRLVADQFLPQRLLYMPSSLLRDAITRYPEYTNKQSLKIFVGTYNVNGKKDKNNLLPEYGNLSDWLTNIADQRGYRNPNASPEAFQRPVDIFAIGFQEIVDLNASNIVAAKQSTDSQKFWANEISSTINRDRRIEEDYVLISTLQLVGLCVFVFMRASLCEFVRGLSVGSVKTGLHGTAGNKGAVAVRLELGATSICFCCCHFTAGQSAVQERTSEFRDISSRSFLTGKRTVASHNHTFWFGDMNYRIGLSKDASKDPSFIEKVKSLVQQNRLLDLHRLDQLSEQRRSAGLFEGYSEGLLLFPPTYKYALLQDEYDSSPEKPRVPSWTDRIFWRCAKLNFGGRSDSPSGSLPSAQSELGIADEVSNSLLAYCRAELKISDHRPVGALFDVDVLLVDRKQRRRVLEEVILANGPADATVRIRWTSEGGVEVHGSDIYMSVVEIAMCSGTVLVPRFRSNDELLLTFASPSEAVEAVRCLNGNKVSTEAGSKGKIVNVKLSVCLDSAPGLQVRQPAPTTFQDQLNICADEPSARSWLTEMNNIVKISEENYLRTHGPDPAISVFKPRPRRGSPNHQAVMRKMSEYEDYLFDPPPPYSESVALPAAKIHPSPSFTTESSLHEHLPEGFTRQLPPRPDCGVIPASYTNYPAPIYSGLASLTASLPHPLHPVSSCVDLSAEDSASCVAQFDAPSPHNLSAMASPAHIALRVEAPPRPPPPRPEPTSCRLESEPLVALDHPVPTALPPPDIDVFLTNQPTGDGLPPPLVPQRVAPPLPPRPLPQ